MILSNTTNNKTKISISKLFKLIKFLNNMKTSKKILNNPSDQFNIKRQKIKQNPVNYIINVIISSTNTIINVRDSKGKNLLTMSAGLIKLTKSQKRVQPQALLNLFKILVLKAKYLQGSFVVLHFKNVKRFYESFLVSTLKKKFIILGCQSYNLVPHNGCRPKKIKRVKRRTKRLVIR